jgi:branched-chain amino acid transport system ATP-binding protein
MIRTAHPTRADIAKDLKQGSPLLELRNAVATYGGIRALNGVSLHVYPGEIVALVGANGAGKSTTLRSIAGLVSLAEGEIQYASKPLAKQTPETLVALGISLVPEGRAIFPNLTVRENLEIGAYLHRNAKVMSETLEDVTSLFPRLGERMKQEGGTLSGGEQQMLAIGRALMARPALLLLDEPSLGIAPKLAQQIFVAIKQIAQSGVTVLVVEQNTRVALKSSDRAYVLRTGEVVMEGKSSDLIADPNVQKAYLGS